MDFSKMSLGGKFSLMALAILMAGTTVALIGAQQSTETRSSASVTPPVVDTTASARGSSTSVLTFAHTTNANANRMLLVGVSVGSSTTKVNAITYAGIPLTKISRKANNYTSQELWYLAPVNATGVNNVVINLSGSVGSIVAGSVGLSNVDQANPIGSYTGVSGSYGSSTSVSVASTANQLVVDALSTYLNVSASPKSGQTTLWNLPGDGSAATRVLGAGSFKAAASGTTTTGWNLSTNRYWSEIAVAINPVSVTPTATPTLMPTATPIPTATPTPGGPTATPTPTPVPGSAAPVLCPACNFASYVSVGNRLSGHDFTNGFFPAIYGAGQNLSSSNFTGAAFNQATLTTTNMTNSNFTNADFTSADLTGASTTGATFTGATWSNTTCPDGTNSDADGGTCVGHLQ